LLPSSSSAERDAARHFGEPLIAAHFVAATIATIFKVRDNFRRYAYFELASARATISRKSTHTRSTACSYVIPVAAIAETMSFAAFSIMFICD
jgi:hypothetical protein